MFCQLKGALVVDGEAGESKVDVFLTVVCCVSVTVLNWC